MSPADQVWNRACMAWGGPRPRPGDLALVAMVRLHSRAMSGGLLDAVEGSSALEISDSVAAFRYFGLHDAAVVVEWVAEQAEATDLDEVEAAGALEAQADDRYTAVVADDSVLTEAFGRIYETRPEAFSPPE